jgi:hypothetical protein
MAFIGKNSVTSVIVINDEMREKVTYFKYFG